MSAIAVIMDGGPERAAATIDGLVAAGAAARDVQVLPTTELDPSLGAFAAAVIGPGSPYDRMEPVLEAIRTAREKGLPLVGT